MASLPAFEKYDLAQFDAWLEVYIASLQKQCPGWWEEELYERRIARVSERAGLVREQLASGDVALRPMPPHGKMPRYAVELLRALDPPPRAPIADGGSTGSSFSARPVVPPGPDPEITVLCVPPGFPSIGIRYPVQHSSSGVTALVQSGDNEHASRGSVGQASQSLPGKRRGARRLAPEKIEREGRRIEELRNQGHTWPEVAKEMRLGERTCRERLDRLQELTREGR
jgi:hypothetical protein